MYFKIFQKIENYYKYKKFMHCCRKIIKIYNKETKENGKRN